GREQCRDGISMEVLGNLSCKEQGPPLFPGEAYLAAGQGRAATAEFHKILGHRSIVWNCWTGALARLRVAHANVHPYLSDWRHTMRGMPPVFIFGTTNSGWMLRNPLPTIYLRLR